LPDIRVHKTCRVEGQMKSSIIIPTAGRPFAIRAAIQSLFAGSPDKNDTEILVVDNNTQEELARDLHGYCASLNGQVRYIRESNPGSSAARHRGINESRGELLSFIDDDVEVSHGWLSAIQRAFEDPAVALVGGPSIPKFTDSIPAWFWSFLSPTLDGGWMCSWLSLLDIGQNAKYINPNFVWGLNFSIRRSVIERFGGFHPDIVPPHLQRWQGDGETGLTLRLAAADFRADYVQEALVLHLCGSNRLNPKYFAKRAYFQGVCDSFTRIRSGRGPTPLSMPQVLRSIYTKYRKTAGRVLHRLLGRGFPWTKEGAAIKTMTDEAYIAGWRFHQTEVADDPKLLAWVRRADYLDANVWKEMA
jgi:glycosyltransferase involved in cell wall biosynthesis